MKHNLIIADSSGLFSLLIETDSNHTKALEFSKTLAKASEGILIPEDVFSELMNILGKKFDHTRAILAAQFLLDSDAFLIESISEQIRKDALEKFSKQPKSVSFTDCVVMAFADAFGVKKVFGFDDVFKKNGY